MEARVDQREASDVGPGHPPALSEEMVGFLERDQLVADTSVPVALAPLGPRLGAALWVLRLLVVVVSAMVVYSFVDQLR